MRGARLTLSLLLVAALACRADKTVPEQGAVLVQVSCAPGAPVPDELRVWVYDDSGVLWDGVRIPAQGPLVAESQQRLGTILIAPGVARGRLRIHLRGFAGGVRILDGLLTVESLAGDGRTYPLLLASGAPADGDGDDVPDVIDDCPGLANPAQGGCNVVPIADAAVADGPAGGPERLPGSSDGLNDGSDGGGADTAADARVGEGDADARGEADDAIVADLSGRSDGGPPGDVGPQTADSRGDLGAAPDVAGPDRVPDIPSADRREAGADIPADASGDAAPDREPDSPPDAGVDTVDTAGDGSASQDDGAPTKSQGELCAANEECSSGACADGVCCSNACLGKCRSCNQPSANGVCQGYAAGSDPELECATGSTCNGVGACGGAPPADAPNGYLCTAPSQCRSGYCVDGVCCNTECTTACMTCGGGSCVAVKRADDVPECTGTNTCNPAGKCVTR